MLRMKYERISMMFETNLDYWIKYLGEWCSENLNVVLNCLWHLRAALQYTGEIRPSV